jgi:hypothetical protein
MYVCVCMWVADDVHFSERATNSEGMGEEGVGGDGEEDLTWTFAAKSSFGVPGLVRGELVRAPLPCLGNVDVRVKLDGSSLSAQRFSGEVIVALSPCMSLSASGMHVCIHTYVHIHTYTYIHTYLHTYIRIYIRTYEPNLK